MRRPKLLPFAALICGLTLFASCHSSEFLNRRDAQLHHLTHDNLTRSYWLHLPPQADSLPLPLLLCYHGYGSKPRNLMTYSNFNNIADREGFIAVYPRGVRHKGKRHWNVGGWIEGSTVDDVHFTVALIDTLRSRYPVDTTRIYATGMSNGSFMTQLLACQLSDRIAAFASVAGSMTPETYRDCAPTRPIPMLHLHGTTDNIVPFDGGYPWTTSIDSVIKYWVAHNGNATKPIVTALPDLRKIDFSQPIRYLYTAPPDSDAEVQLYKIVQGGHDWFGAWGNRDIRSSEIIWAFLSRYRLPE